MKRIKTTKYGYRFSSKILKQKKTSHKINIHFYFVYFSILGSIDFEYYFEEKLLYCLYITDAKQKEFCARENTTKSTKKTYAENSRQ